MRLAWFQVAETGDVINRLNERSRTNREPGVQGFEVWTHHASYGPPFYSAYNWATGDRRNLTEAEAEKLVAS